MKPFTIEMPVLRTNRRGSFISDTGISICKYELDKLYCLSRVKSISFRLSTKMTVDAYAVRFYRFADYNFHCFVNEKVMATNLSVNVWLRENTPLGTLKPGESATVYVTLYVHGEE